MAAWRLGGRACLRGAQRLAEGRRLRQEVGPGRAGAERGAHKGAAPTQADARLASHIAAHCQNGTHHRARHAGMQRTAWRSRAAAQRSRHAPSP